MKIKNIQLSLAVFLCLVVLSFSLYTNAQQDSNANGNIFLDSDQDGLTDQEEMLYETDVKNSDTDGDGYSDGVEIKSGYDPKKPSPGDKLIEPITSPDGEVAGEETENNLTNKIAQEITAMVENAETDEESANITLDQLQEIIDQTMETPENSDDDLPEIKEEDIKILTQNYSKFSDEEQKKRKKEDFLNYTVAVAYIFSSNSPEPITSNQDLGKIVTAAYKTVIQSIEARDVSSLSSLEKSGDKILEQLKGVEVPEEMVETHIKAMRYAMYAKELGKTLTPVADDPLQDIANFSKMQTFIESIMEFTSDIQGKFAEYEIIYDDDLQKKLKDFGLDWMKIEETESASEED